MVSHSRCIPPLGVTVSQLRITKKNRGKYIILPSKHYYWLFFVSLRLLVFRSAVGWSGGQVALPIAGFARVADRAGGPALQGPTSKMSASNTNSAIFLTDRSALLWGGISTPEQKSGETGLHCDFKTPYSDASISMMHVQIIEHPTICEATPLQFCSPIFMGTSIAMHLRDSKRRWARAQPFEANPQTAMSKVGLQMIAHENASHGSACGPRLQREGANVSEHHQSSQSETPRQRCQGWPLRVGTRWENFDSEKAVSF